MGFGCVNSGCELLCKRLCRVRRLQSSTFSLTFSLRSHLRPVRGANETALALRQSFLSYGSSGTRSRSQPLPSHCGGPEHDSQSPVSFALPVSCAHPPRGKRALWTAFSSAGRNPQEIPVLLGHLSAMCLAKNE